MTSEKFLCLFIFLATFFKGNYFSNSTQIELPEAALIKAKQVQPENETLIAVELHSGSTERNSKVSLTSPEQTTILSEFGSRGINSTAAKQSEVIEIFRGVTKNANGTDGVTVNSILVTDCVNISSVNMTCAEPSWNDTVKTNYTLIAEAAKALNSEVSSLGTEKLAAISAGVFLVSAVIGYLSCVGYRRFLQRKYGNSQILIAEEVYDTSDLRYFEI